MTPLIRAWDHCHLDIVKILIDHGAEIDDRDEVSDILLLINIILIKLIDVWYRLEGLHSCGHVIIVTWIL